jgi:hypothetical protein
VAAMAAMETALLINHQSRTSRFPFPRFSRPLTFATATATAAPRNTA